ncbi:K02A2.6-like [Cordylochernes scorpioides]|uniref:RNA-directed DNA polymerase n=1 Tax=Cordylochernes scorpioides TaxID=51811 RepID=A0ABY6K7C0_9ARAC|nr:K02A2.6-like [Cordylochernes scorpioides]
MKLATKLGLSQELILEGLTSGIESEFERLLIAASPTSLERWLEIAEAIEVSHCRTTSSASGMELGYPARRRPSTSWQGGQGFRPRNWGEGRNDRPGIHLPPTRSQTASLAAVQDHEDSGSEINILPRHLVPAEFITLIKEPKLKSLKSLLNPSRQKQAQIVSTDQDINIFSSKIIRRNAYTPLTQLLIPITPRQRRDLCGENKFNIKLLNIQPPRLRLSDKKPVCVRPYRHSFRDRDLIKQQIEQLLKYGLIKPASSLYSAPVTLAPKKGEGRVRLCIDYRLLNRKIISDSFPIPLMEDIVQKVQGARVFSCLDILSAYWTIPLHPKDREMTCFSTSEGSYVWCRLPFGLKTAPAIFNRKLSAILQKYKLDNVTSYFDDILVFSENEESHLKHLGQIFEILKKEGIQLRRDKCLLFMKRITYLGYEISENQISPSGVNVDVIKSLPPPRDLRCLRSFLGSVTHYAKFIKNFNNLRAPLNELLKKNSRFIWTEECQRSFEGLKEALCSKPILQLFNPSLATHIYCDASISGIGAVLKQEYPDGTQKPFTYFSRALRGAECKYTITELELLAVVETCKRYHPYISGSHVIVHTDHKALIWLNSFKHTNGRLFRWSLKLSEYDLDFNYNKGYENHEADILSRLPYSYFLSAQALKQNQGDLSIPPSKLYSMVDGITYIRLNNKDRVVVPQELQDDLIQKAHESLGHPGISAMIRALSVQYYFKGMIGKIKNYVKNCKECQTIKSSTQPSYGLMGSFPRAAKPFEVVALDTVLGLGGYNSAKNCVHTVIDHHSRYILGYASKGTSIATYINIINQLLNIGKPRILVTDRHPSFVSKKFNKFLQEKGIKHVMTSPSHPECNGLLERANATLIGRLKIQHQGNPRAPWPKLLQKTLEEYRNTPHSTTTFPPIYLLYGALPSYMSDLTNPYPPVEEARTIANEKNEELHKRYNSSHRFPNLKIGDKVLYRIPYQVGHGKLSPVYYPDPYTVLYTPSPHIVEINKPCQPENKPSTIVNVSKLKLWDPISTSNEGMRNYPFPFQDVEDLNGCI